MKRLGTGALALLVSLLLATLVSTIVVTAPAVAAQAAPGDPTTATSEWSCAGGDGVITVTITNPGVDTRFFRVSFNNTARSASAAGGATTNVVMSGLVDTTITVKVVELTSDIVVLEEPEAISCDAPLTGSAVATCVGSDGVITLTITNSGPTSLVYRASFNNTHRSGLVPASVTTTQVMSGLSDATFVITLINRTADPEVVAYSQDVAVSCDGGGAGTLIANVGSSCTDQGGVITFTLENTSNVGLAYLVAVNNTRRGGIVPAGATITSAISGLADLTFSVSAYSTSPDPDIELINEALAVNCTASPALTATHQVSCENDTGSITVDLTNDSSSLRWYRVTYNSTVRVSVVAANSTKAVKTSGLSDTMFVVTASDLTSNPDELILDVQAQVSCAPLPDPVGWDLVWSDEFTGNTVDPAKWQVVTGSYGTPYRVQQYTDKPENVRVANGSLILQGTHDPNRNDPYESGMLISNDENLAPGEYRRGNLGWTYGRFEMRAKLPYGKGLWPALWMRSLTNEYGTWPNSGEIDIVEYLGPQGDRPAAPVNSVIGNIHWSNNGAAQQNRGDTPITQAEAEEFHVYSVEWEHGTFRWYFDGVLFHQVNTWETELGDFPAPFDQPFGITLNLQLGGWAGTPDPADFPGSMELDWIRVYERPE